MRTEFKRVQNIHDGKKSIYNKLSSKLASSRNYLEKECKRLQSDWKKAERNYHYLASANEIIGGHVDKAMKENDWQNGGNKMLPDFQCLHDLYEHKLVQQENLAKQLRTEQRQIKDHEPENNRQVSRGEGSVSRC